MKRFLICYVMTTIFYIFFFGNMNFFGEQGFHMDIDTIITIMATWSLISAVIISVLISIMIDPKK